MLVFNFFQIFRQISYADGKTHHNSKIKMENIWIKRNFWKTTYFIGGIQKNTEEFKIIRWNLKEYKEFSSTQIKVWFKFWNRDVNFKRFWSLFYNLTKKINLEWVLDFSQFLNFTGFQIIWKLYVFKHGFKNRNGKTLCLEKYMYFEKFPWSSLGFWFLPSHQNLSNMEGILRLEGFATGSPFFLFEFYLALIFISKFKLFYYKIFPI